MKPTSDIIIYEGGEARVEVRLNRETVWLTQEHMSQLFKRERSVITKHLRNVFAEGELEREAVCAKFAHTAADGKTYQVEYYNLDVIISVVTISFFSSILNGGVSYPAFSSFSFAILSFLRLRC